MAARPRLKMRAGSGIWQDAMRAARFSFPRFLRAATMQKRRSGCSRSTLAGENGAHSKHSIMRRRSIVWQQSTSAKRSVVTLPLFLAPVINLLINALPEFNARDFFPEAT